MLQISPGSEQSRGPLLLLTEVREKLSRCEVNEREDPESQGAQTQKSAARLERISRAAGLEGTRRTTSASDAEFYQLCHSARRATIGFQAIKYYFGFQTKKG
jgi:hypothetical protein